MKVKIKAYRNDKLGLYQGVAELYDSRNKLILSRNALSVRTKISDAIHDAEKIFS